MPFDTQSGIIAAGVNFKAHAEETGLEDGPFLFPKLSTPSAWQAPVTKRTRLDYEVELCAVAIEDIAPGKSGRFGFVLCNDLTDRWALLRHINLKKPMGRTGFPEINVAGRCMPRKPIFTNRLNWVWRSMIGSWLDDLGRTINRPKSFGALR